MGNPPERHMRHALSLGSPWPGKWVVRLSFRILYDNTLRFVVGPPLSYLLSGQWQPTLHMPLAMCGSLYTHSVLKASCMKYSLRQQLPSRRPAKDGWVYNKGFWNFLMPTGGLVLRQHFDSALKMMLAHAICYSCN